MKAKFYISAIYTSPPGTMGGNTKIMLEIIDNLVSKYDFIILTTEPKTFQKNLKNIKRVKIVSIKYPFPKFSYKSHIKEIQYVKDYFDKYFAKNNLTSHDYFYSCSDFAPDVLPIVYLKEKYSFTWIATLYLFIPSPIDNIINHYQFPFIKYVVYFFYQKYIFTKIVEKGDLFVITNEYDKKMFTQKYRSKVFAIYGGVNAEQIEKAKNDKKLSEKYDAVFCSRLHPQKGISQLLEIWRDVINKNPKAKLAVIGNGEKKYVKSLKQKAMQVGVNNNIEWLGYVNNTEKYKIYLQSKMLLHATVYDNNGMVAAEALSSGLPVVMYDLLPLKKLYTAGCIKIPLRDKKAFADNTLRMLNDNKYYNRIKPTKFDINNAQKLWKWEYRTELFYNFIKQNEKY